MLSIINIDLLLVFSPVGYLNNILIPDTNKVLNDPVDLGEIMILFFMFVYGLLG